jgi:hypothetical protein
MDAWERMPHESERLTTLTVTRQVEGKDFAATRFTRRFEISRRKPEWHLRGSASQFKFECCVIQ